MGAMCEAYAANMAYHQAKALQSGMSPDEVFSQRNMMAATEQAAAEIVGQHSYGLGHTAYPTPAGSAQIGSSTQHLQSLGHHSVAGHVNLPSHMDARSREAIA